MIFLVPHADDLGAGHNTGHNTGHDLDWLVEELSRWRAEKRQDGGYVCGTFAGNRRVHQEMLTRTMITLDIDAGTADTPERIHRALGCRVIAHTTHNSTPEAPRWRVILPIKAPIPASLYRPVVEALIASLPDVEIDPCSAKATQMMFWPSGLHCLSADFAGEPLDATLLAVDSTTRRAARRKKDPREIGGPAGEFNAVWHGRWAELIEEYGLPYTACGARYRYADSKGAPGAAPIGDDQAFWFSHHASDPAYGRACGPFDLVARHKHGHLDTGVEAQNPMHMPSAVAFMADLGKQQLIDAFADEYPEQAEQADWLAELATDKRGIMLQGKNLKIIAENHPLLQTIATDIHTQRVTIDLGAGREDMGDQAALEVRVALEELAQRPVSRAIIDEVVAYQAARHRHNQVADFLHSLVWDGVPRLYTCLPVAERTAHTDAMLRVMFLQAVARGLHPGCEAQQTPVLYGEAGVGKSTWLEAYSVKREWRGVFVPPRPGADNSESALARARRWVLAWEELGNEAFTHEDALKTLLSESQVTARKKYGRYEESYQVSSVVWATTNHKRFLPAGSPMARRFLPLHFVRSETQEHLSPEFVEQVWAEAVHMYREGAPLTLTREESEAHAEYCMDWVVLSVYDDRIAEWSDGEELREVVSVREVLREALMLPSSARITPRVRRDVMTALANNGWERTDAENYRRIG